MVHTCSKITVVGAGNVATHLALALKGCGYEICAVFSRTSTAADLLAHKVGAIPLTDIKLLPASDAFIYCVKDDVLRDIACTVSAMHPKALHIHTSGSTPINVFAAECAHYGVAYPLQTFTKSAVLDLSEVTCFIEADNSGTLVKIRHLLSGIMGRICELDSDGRLRLHTAAVFACNFVNHCYSIAETLLSESGLPFEVLLPLVDETARKVHEMSPVMAQTGPAVRYDMTIIQKHMHLLSKKPLLREIYGLMSRSIYQQQGQLDHETQ